MTTVVWTGTDVAGNDATCEIVMSIMDNEPPVFINCPENVTFTVGLFSDDCQGGAIWSIPIATDNDEVTVTQTDGPAQGDLLDVGTYNIQYTAEDASGNTATCNFVIEVIDTQDPIIVCPGNIIEAETDPGVCYWTSPPNSLSPLYIQSNCPATVEWEVEKSRYECEYR